MRNIKEDLEVQIEGINGKGISDERTNLYRDISDELRRLLVSKMDNKDVAEEIAQHAFQRLCRLKHNRDDGNLRSYLFNMAVRLAINVLCKRQAASAQDYAKATDFEGRSVYESLLGELKVETIKDSLVHLSEKTRYIFLLYRFEGLSCRAIAKKLALSDRSVEEHIKLARARIMQATAEFRRFDGQGYEY